MNTLSSQSLAGDRVKRGSVLLEKKSVVLIFIAILIASSVVQQKVETRVWSARGFELLMTDKERDVRALSSVVESLVHLERLDILEGHLTDAIKIGWIDFFMLTYKGDVISYNSRRKLSDQAYWTIAQEHPPGSIWEFDSKYEEERSILRGPAASAEGHIEDFRFMQTDLGSDRSLKLGFNIDRGAFIADVEERSRDQSRRVLVLGILLTLGIFLFSARDILKITRIVRQKGLKGLREVAILSREAEALKKGFEGYGETVEQLREKNRVLSNQVLPSLKTELQSGKEPPYDFFCTMVRTDINNFTQIFHSYPVDVFLGYINRFFNECSHVVSRYDGLIHEFVGDEIIYYFKDEDHSNSFTAALACAAEVAEVARRIHEQTSKTDGYDFRVKSSLSYGQIRFGPMLNGFSLAGAPLIETTRILSAVNDKSENTIHFDSSQTERLYAGVRFEEGFKASLKGMPGERVILRYLGHEPVESVMKQATLPDAIQDYRSDHELTQMLLYVRDELAQPSGPNPFVFSVVRALSRVKVTTCGANLARALHETVRGLLHAPHKEFAEESVREMDRVLATLAISLPKLLPNEWIDGDTENLLIDLIEYRDDRVVANTIESMQALRDRGFDLRKIDRQLMSSRNTRVAANSTVFVGTDEISKDVVRKVESMLADENPIVVTAGLFAWGEIARHHLQEDPVYYRTQVRFQRLSEKFARVLERYPELEAAVQQAMRKANMNLEKASGAAGQAA